MGAGPVVACDETGSVATVAGVGGGEGRTSGEECTAEGGAAAADAWGAGEGDAEGRSGLGSQESFIGVANNGTPTEAAFAGSPAAADGGEGADPRGEVGVDVLAGGVVKTGVSGEGFGLSEVTRSEGTAGTSNWERWSHEGEVGVGASRAGEGWEVAGGGEGGEAGRAESGEAEQGYAAGGAGRAATVVKVDKDESAKEPGDEQLVLLTPSAGVAIAPA